MPVPWMLPNYGICHVKRRRSGGCRKRPKVACQSSSCWLASAGGSSRSACQAIGRRRGGRQLSDAASRYLRELFRALIETDCKGTRKPELSWFGYRRTILVETIPFSALRESTINGAFSASD
jgi:hypothetical protein